MLTEAILRSNQILASLTSEQIAAITTLSQNDENQVIAGKYGEIYGGIDTVIEEITGEKKPQGVKTTDWTKNKLSDLKTKADKVGDNTELDKLKTELEQAKKDLKENAGDKSLKAEVDKLAKEVADERQRVKDLQAQVSTKDQTHTEALSQKAYELLEMKAKTEFAMAIAGKQRRAGLEEDEFNELIENRTSRLLEGVKIEEFERDGKKVLRYIDKATNKVMTNPDDLQNDFKSENLYLSKVGDLFDKGRQQNGTGTQPPKGQGGGGTGAKVDMSGVKTKTEATDRFNNHWMKVEGKPMTHPDYNKEYQETIKTLPADLPMA